MDNQNQQNMGMGGQPQAQPPVQPVVQPQIQPQMEQPPVVPMEIQPQMTPIPEPAPLQPPVVEQPTPVAQPQVQPAPQPQISGQPLTLQPEQPTMQDQMQSQLGQPQQGYQQLVPNQGDKKAIVAGLLGIFLGTIGIHSFYLGYKRDGIIHVAIAGVGIILAIIAGVLTASSVSVSSLVSGAYAQRVAVAGVLSLIGWIAISASSIWGLIEGIMILTKPKGKYGQDANGSRLA